MLYHATPRRHRDAIRQYGLLPNLPNCSQLFGVYAFQDEAYHDTRMMRGIGGRWRRVRVWWDYKPPNDLWQIAYVGPITPDQFVENGFVLDAIPPEHVSLVSQLS